MGAKKEKYARRIEERVRSVEERMDKVEIRQMTSDGFNRYLEEAADRYSNNNNSLKAQHRRELRQAQEEARQWKLNAYLTLALLTLVAAVCLVWVSAEEAPQDGPVVQAIPTDGSLPGDDVPALVRCSMTEEEVQEDFENERIEAALLARATKIEDVTITFYCCEKYPHICGTGTGITSSGRTVTPYVSCAVDQNIIPLGSTIMIEYNGEIVYMRADDTGSSINGNHIDIAVPTHSEAVLLGVKAADIYWCEEG